MAQSSVGSEARSRGRSRRTPRAADVLAVPLHRDLYAVAQVLETGPSLHGCVAVFGAVVERLEAAASAADAPVLAILELDLAAVRWQGWSIALAGATARARIDVPRSVNATPCLPGLLGMVRVLQDEGLLPATFRAYGNLGTCAPRLREAHGRFWWSSLDWLRRGGLLSAAGLAELTTDRLAEDFSMHSGLLTTSGVEFFDKVFDRTYQHRLPEQLELEAMLDELWAAPGAGQVDSSPLRPWRERDRDGQLFAVPLDDGRQVHCVVVQTQTEFGYACIGILSDAAGDTDDLRVVRQLPLGWVGQLDRLGATRLGQTDQPLPLALRYNWALAPQQFRTEAGRT